MDQLQAEIKLIREELEFIKKQAGIVIFIDGPCGKCNTNWLVKKGKYDMCYNTCDICNIKVCPNCLYGKCQSCKNRCCIDHYHTCVVCEIGYCIKCMIDCTVCDKQICPDTIRCDYYNEESKETTCTLCPVCTPTLSYDFYTSKGELIEQISCEQHHDFIKNIILQWK